MKTALVFVGLLAILLSIRTSQVRGGDYGCGSRYFAHGYTYSYPTYSYPTYSPPAYCPPTYSAPNVYNTPVETFYRVAPDLAQARVAQEAAAETLKQFKAELSAQAEAQRKVLAEQKDAEFKAQVLQLLASRQVSPQVVSAGGDPDRERLIAENQQLRSLIESCGKQLEKVNALAASQPQPQPSAPAVPSPPTAPPVTNPPAGSPTVPEPAKLDLHGKAPAEAFKVVTASLCMPCHSQPGRLNLTDPTRLNYEDYTDAINRMISDDPKFVMPPPKAGHGTAPLEAIGAFHKLAMTAPHRPTGNNPNPPPPPVPAPIPPAKK